MYAWLVTFHDIHLTIVVSADTCSDAIADAKAHLAPILFKVGEPVVYMIPQTTRARACFTIDHGSGSPRAMPIEPHFVLSPDPEIFR